MRGFSSDRVQFGWTKGQILGLCLAFTLMGVALTSPAASQELPREKATALAAVEDLQEDLLDISMASGILRRLPSWRPPQRPTWLTTLKQRGSPWSGA